MQGLKKFEGIDFVDELARLLGQDGLDRHLVQRAAVVLDGEPTRAAGRDRASDVGEHDHPRTDGVRLWHRLQGHRSSLPRGVRQSPRRTTGGSMSRYAALRQHLASLPPSCRSTYLSMKDIDALVGGLPPSARAHRTWWANNSHGHAIQWREAGWHVDSVDLQGEQVRFARGRVGGSRADAATARPRRSAERASSAAPSEPPQDLLPTTVMTSVRLRWTWAGPVTLAENRLRFPVTAREGGIYRMTLKSSDAAAAVRAYIGQSGDLRQRMGNYRNPQPRQQTSWRINELLVAHLQDGGTVSLEICTDAERGDGAGQWTQLDLTRVTCRLLAESAALLALDDVDGVLLQNKAELVTDAD
ncbi:MAG: hypothetical protein WCD35_19635 [Mycobacteriales bacterium]